MWRYRWSAASRLAPVEARGAPLQCSHRLFRTPGLNPEKQVIDRVAEDNPAGNANSKEEIVRLIWGVWAVALIIALLLSGCAPCKQFGFHNDEDDRQLCIQRRS
jgi:hypothetical protein